MTAREAAAGEQLASQLDALSRPLAERILGRAIEMQSDADSAAEAGAATIDYEQLQAIALEVGIPEAALQQALVEELETERDHGATQLEKITAPRHVRGGTIVEGDRNEVVARLRAYLEETEGMRLDSEDGPRLRWAEARRSGAGRGSVVESRTTDQRSERRHLLEIDFSTARGRRLARRLALIAVILGTVFGGALGGFAILGGILVGIGAGIAGAVSVLRRFAHKARNKINRALEAAVDDRGGSGDRTWLDIWESQQRR